MENSHKISTVWKNNLTFVSEIDQHKLIMDSSTQAGGNDLGPSPKKLLLAALAGCTGMDVISILQKMRVSIAKFEIEVQGTLTEEHPKFYKEMHVTYKLSGHDIPKEKVEKAVKMSEETYCGVGALFRKAIKINSDIVITET